MVVSDGRGIFSEGETRVIQAVRRARQMGIFLVYVIIDNPDNKDSIMDIRRPLFDPVTNSLSASCRTWTRFRFRSTWCCATWRRCPAVLGRRAAAVVRAGRQHCQLGGMLEPIVGGLIRLR
ncbi:unnamed protein product [Plutella xylostella]|uniref:(diamondback moth) hypothetical protein n=1 Tax=Plutella xylostella TaxID=51655 RepID=A0A8S4FAP1_PLUXY|nr:unnamed protein product [Plutella xylostella]